MLIYSEKLFTHYFNTLYFFGVVIVALFYIVIKERENINSILFSRENEQPNFSVSLLIFPSVLLFLESGISLWLYMNKELWMARRYLAELGAKLSNEFFQSNGYYYFSDYIWRDTQLYSLKYHFNLWLNSIIAIFVVFVLVSIFIGQHKVVDYVLQGSTKRKKLFYLGILYIPFIVGIIIITSAYVLIKE